MLKKVRPLSIIFLHKMFLIFFNDKIPNLLLLVNRWRSERKLKTFRRMHLTFIFLAWPRSVERPRRMTEKLARVWTETSSPERRIARASPFPGLERSHAQKLKKSLAQICFGALLLLLLHPSVTLLSQVGSRLCKVGSKREREREMEREINFVLCRFCRVTSRGLQQM